MNLDHVFVCGHPALDFAATLRARRSIRFEMFVTPDRLNAWYLESGLVDTITPGEPDDVRAAIALREAVYRLVTDRRLGEDFDRQALAVLNAAARQVPVTPQLTLAGRHTDATPQQALATVARQAVELLSGPDVPLLKECGNPECTRVYIDRSRGMRRQWCGMESCGNKIKAAAYRARKKTTPTAAGS
ncbi:CGNR zinc finger domain-containing protein [Streptomyces olivochromogenes]|uniref:CGNR zinc finger domain-containing protein n=1 Tax=Streptomyces olivochromogenes TaxID=1963 RepID=UPI001F425D93|nr:CGNR zinc finger domain-containing protein [Streptomyces olivochromogenes]MCF3131563.1 ABATE domain-containing protein [Streptomyces olivochromogenes]